MRLNAQRSKLGSCGRTKIQPDANLKKSEANDEQGLFRSCRDATRVLSLEPDAVRIVAALAARSVEGAVSGEPRRALRRSLEGSAPARRRRGPHLAEWMKPERVPTPLILEPVRGRCFAALRTLVDSTRNWIGVFGNGALHNGALIVVRISSILN